MFWDKRATHKALKGCITEHAQKNGNPTRTSQKKRITDFKEKNGDAQNNEKKMQKSLKKLHFRWIVLKKLWYNITVKKKRREKGKCLKNNKNKSYLQFIKALAI